jgi:hypothetical protein
LLKALLLPRHAFGGCPWFHVEPSLSSPSWHGGFAGGATATPAEHEAADEAEHTRTNVFINGHSLCFEEHHNKLLSKSGANRLE